MIYQAPCAQSANHPQIVPAAHPARQWQRAILVPGRQCSHPRPYTSYPPPAPCTRAYQMLLDLRDEAIILFPAVIHLGGADCSKGAATRGILRNMLSCSLSLQLCRDDFLAPHLAMGGQASSARGMRSCAAAERSRLSLTCRPHSASASCGDRLCLLVAPTTMLPGPCSQGDNALPMIY